MAWSPKTQIFSDTFGATEKFATGFRCGPDVTAQVQVRGSFGGTTDDIVVSIYGNLDPKTYSGTSVAIAAGGTNYTVGDILTMVGGVFETATTVRVLTLGGSDAVASIEVVEDGDYTETPADAITTSGGTGTGCTLNGDWEGDDWDTEVAESYTLLNQVNPMLKSSFLTNYYRLRVGVVGGSTDTNSAIINVRTWSRAR
ncbi:MAG: hypothetical protein ACYTDW_09670 [Planctomycetota bacterium]|jgi:hypothetical protein